MYISYSISKDSVDKFIIIHYSHGTINLLACIKLNYCPQLANPLTISVFLSNHSGYVCTYPEDLLNGYARVILAHGRRTFICTVMNGKCLLRGPLMDTSGGGVIVGALFQ